ncbi:MAG: LysM peptidoglycan-binding domain-containing protein [Syntrophales bacterium]|nr:LysM peptidoglycan-binding domain-containing protein [Syntrophales bacterium]
MPKLRIYFIFFVVSMCVFLYSYTQSEAEDRSSLAGTAGKKPAVEESPCTSETKAVVKEREEIHKQTEAIEANRRPKQINITSSEDANKQQEETEEAIMEEALELLNGSQNYWAKGDLESALNLLDQAYALLLDTDGHPEIARQKDDLRLLIAKQILVIYTSRQTLTNGKRGEIPLVMNADVEKEIRNFQTIERDFFIQSYKRSGLYRPIILRELKKAGLPEELSWLPLVESGFKISAFSRARALGLWQFISSTGYKYGLNRDEWVDERMDVESSTRAAIAYLKELHNMFGDWLTVLAAYNCGEGRVLRVISSQHLNYLDRFWDLYHQLPNETARYVPRFLATLHIIKDPQKYGIDLIKDEELPVPPPYEWVKTYKPMRLQDIALHLNISEELLNTLNAELRHKITPDREYELKVPLEVAEEFALVGDEIPRWEKPAPVSASIRPVLIKHRVKRKETISSIARRYKTSVRAIRAYNHLSCRGIRVGQYLNIPIRSYRYARIKADQQPEVTEELTRYRVKKGDTLLSLAKRFDTTVSKIKKINRLKGNMLKSGQIIMVAYQKGEGNNSDEGKKATRKKRNRRTASVKTVERTYTVKKGDCLIKIARENNVALDELLDLNNLARKDTITPGQIIIVK